MPSLTSGVLARRAGRLGSAETVSWNVYMAVWDSETEKVFQEAWIETVKILMYWS